MYGERDGPVPSTNKFPLPVHLVVNGSSGSELDMDIEAKRQEERENMAAQQRWLCWNNDFLRVASTVQSHVLFGHIRAATFGENNYNNAHPFVFGNLLWMHNGGIAYFDRVGPKLRSRLSDEAMSLIEGNTDSEHAAALFLDILHDDGSQEGRELRSRRQQRTAELVRRRQQEDARVAPSLLYMFLRDSDLFDTPHQGVNGTFSEGADTCIIEEESESSIDSKSEKAPALEDSNTNMTSEGLPTKSLARSRHARMGVPIGSLVRATSTRPTHYSTSQLRSAMTQTILELDELFEEVSDELYEDYIRKIEDEEGTDAHEQTRREFQNNLAHSSLNFAVSDGRTLVASRYRNSIHDEPPSLYYSVTGGGIVNGRNQAGIQNVFVTSEPLVRGDEAEREYELLGKDEIISVYPQGDKLHEEACLEVGRADSLRVEFSCLSTACKEDQERRASKRAAKENEEPKPDERNKLLLHRAEDRTDPPSIPSEVEEESVFSKLWLGLTGLSLKE
mmetsp:Transcript_33782/g.86647  ORF Transcript_33782/g.86647 Transcript_33782/m.86647 type:complete len:505 (-) Transcript_33782:1270-2784(-)